MIRTTTYSDPKATPDVKCTSHASAIIAIIAIIDQK